MKVKIIKTCFDCDCHSNTGFHQIKPKYICTHRCVAERNKVDCKYWYDYPILGNATPRAKLEIPAWCPLEDYKEND